MTEFSLDDARCNVRSVNFRVERHGEEDRSAVDLKLELTRPATDLAMFGPQLRDALFWRDPSSAEPSLLDEIDPSLEKPNLRCPMLKGPFAIDVSYVGCAVTIEWGLGGPSDIVLDPCKVNRVRIEPLEGGSVVISLRVQYSGIDDKTAGRLAMLIDQETVVSIAAPEQAEVDEEEEEGVTA